MSFEALRVLDEKKMYSDLTSMGDHWRAASKIGEAAELSDMLRGAKQIVWVGMGGSAIGGNLLYGVVGDQLSVPLIVNRAYRLPAFVDEDTLVIAASYSGNTEETLAQLDAATKRGAKVLCISTGGEVQRVCHQDGLPYIAIPGGLQPRCGVIFLFLPVFIALGRLGYFNLEAQDDPREETLRLIDEYAVKMTAPESPAMKLAEKLKGSLPIIYGAHHLEAVVMRWRTQLNENAKTLAFHHLLPEMNHNEIEGWMHPTDVVQRSHVVFLRDEDEHPRTTQRLELTREQLAEEAKPKQITSLRSAGSSRLARLFSLLLLADYTSYYLALLNGVDPSPVERIERFKKRLAKLTR